MVTKAEKQKLRDMADEVARRVALARVESKEDWRRAHYGSSLMGRKCDRFKWQSFHWALAPNHDSRMLRLFERGNREEFMFGDELVAAGYKFRAPDGSDEFRWSEGHMGGECDGIIDDFLGDQRALVEMKTHSVRSFNRLWDKKSVKSCKPEHFVQMQTYMHNLGIRWALYCAVNKNDDSLFHEVVPYDAKVARKVMSEARNLVVMPDVPERMDESYAPCQLISREGKVYPCDYFKLCHGELEVLPERNCRTCLDSTAKPDGSWVCEHHDKVLTKDQQKKGCVDHLYNPGLLNAQITAADKDERRVEYQSASGAKFVDRRQVPEHISKLGKVEKAW